MKFSLNKRGRYNKAAFLGSLMMCCGITQGLAQEQPSSSKEKIYTTAEQMPRFASDISKYLAEHLNYPEAARGAGIQGMVVAKFFVDEKGKVKDPVIEKGIHPDCDEEVLRILRIMPDWKPGKQDGKAVKVYCTLPVSFRLSEEETSKAEEKPGQASKVFVSVEDMPQSSVNLNQYLAANLRYPDAARKAEVQGRVVAQFIVDDKGKVKDPVIVRGLHPECDQEVLRVLQAMPDWKPGMQEGKAVNVYYTLPVSFKLDKNVQDAAGNEAKLDIAATQVVIAPNPATNEVLIENKSSLKIKQVTVCNMSGALMLSSPVNGASKHRINTAKLVRGAYIFNIETDKGVVTKKVLLQ